MSLLVHWPDTDTLWMNSKTLPGFVQNLRSQYGVAALAKDYDHSLRTAPCLVTLNSEQIPSSTVESRLNAGMVGSDDINLPEEGSGISGFTYIL